MLALFSNLLEGVFQGALQERDGHGRRHVEHLATSRHLAIVTIIRELSIYQRFAVVDAARIFANGILNILR